MDCTYAALLIYSRHVDPAYFLYSTLPEEHGPVQAPECPISWLRWPRKKTRALCRLPKSALRPLRRALAYPQLTRQVPCPLRGDPDPMPKRARTTEVSGFTSKVLVPCGTPSVLTLGTPRKGQKDVITKVYWNAHVLFDSLEYLHANGLVSNRSCFKRSQTGRGVLP